MNEQDFLARYDPRAYPPVAVTVDVVALTIRDGALTCCWSARPCRRRGARGRCPAASSGPDEDLADAARRELAEETGLAATGCAGSTWSSSASYGAPDRDPRMRVISVAYLAFAPDLPDPAPGTRRRRRPPGAGRPRCPTPAARLRPRRGSSPTGSNGPGPSSSTRRWPPASSADEFTIAELRAVYETVWGDPLHAGNFHRKVLSVPGSWRAPATSTERGGARGGPRARLYRGRRRPAAAPGAAAPRPRGDRPMRTDEAIRLVAAAGPTRTCSAATTPAPALPRAGRGPAPRPARQRSTHAVRAAATDAFGPGHHPLAGRPGPFAARPSDRAGVAATGPASDAPPADAGLTPATSPTSTPSARNGCSSSPATRPTTT